MTRREAAPHRVRIVVVVSIGVDARHGAAERVAAHDPVDESGYACTDPNADVLRKAMPKGCLVITTRCPASASGRSTGQGVDAPG
jgi:hypothetical protein